MRRWVHGALTALVEGDDEEMTTMVQDNNDGPERDEDGPGPRRRRVQGVTLEKRKVSVTPEEGKQLDTMAERMGVSVSELLVNAALAPDRDDKRGLTPAEAKALANVLIETRTQLCDLVVAVKNDESTEALDAFMLSGKAASDRLYNAVESLVQ
jgi:hypothetical protein